MRRVWLLLCVLLPGLSGCGVSDAGVDRTPAYLVCVTAEETKGSGVLYQEDGTYWYVLTARHVLEGTEQKVTLRFFDGRETESEDISLCGTADLALVRIPREEVSGQLYRCVEWDKESFDGLQAEDACTAVGFGGEREPVRFEGSVLDPWIYMEDYEQFMIWAEVEILPGMSGGALLDSEGRLVGILSGGSGDGETAAVPLSLVWQFLEGW